MRSIENRLAEIQRIARIGSWEWEVPSGRVEWSDETFRILGLDRKTFKAGYREFMGCVHPADRESVRRVLDAALNHEGSCSIEHRILLPDQTIRFVRQQAEVTRNASGTPLLLIGTIQDITETEVVRQKMEALVHQSVGALARAAEVFDARTGDHIQRIGDYCVRLAELVGAEEHYTSVLRQQAQLHDVGKIHVPFEILNKRGPLTAEEFGRVQEHSVYGSIIIGNTPDLSIAWQVALHHHERWDGTGYPDRLRGTEIPFAARVAAIADVFDALITPRSYKEAFTYADAYEIMTHGDERLAPQDYFDPELLGTFLDHYGEFTSIHQNSLLHEIERRNRNLNVFILEDDLPMQNLFRQSIPSSSAARLHVFSTFGEIMEFMASSEVFPDVCFVDVQIPGGSGHDVAREIRSRYPGTYLVCSTGGGSVKERGLYDRIFHKPYRPAKIRQMIELIQIYRMDNEPKPLPGHS